MRTSLDREGRGGWRLVVMAEGADQFNCGEHRCRHDETFANSCNGLAVGNHREAGFAGFGQGRKVAFGFVKNQKEVGKVHAP